MKNLRELEMGIIVSGVLLGIAGLVATGVTGALDLGASASSPATSLLTEAGALAVWGLAHCDSLDGPVVTLARKALDTGNVNLVLPWVSVEDEPTIRTAFDRARTVRGLSAAAREVADTHFFETLVRVHRAAEGEPFTGLKPAGRDLGPAIPAADQALLTGDVESLVAVVRRAVEHGIRQRYERARAARTFDPNDVTAGRAYVLAYVPFIHYVERLYADAAGTLAIHEPGADGAPAHGAHAAHRAAGTHPAH